MQRRTVLKGAAGVGAAGIGAAVLSGSAAAQSEANITAADATVSSDDGTVERVSVLPELTVSWDHFDEEVERVRVLIEARHADGEYYPVFRSTPWLDSEENEWTPGTSGEEVFSADVFGVRGAGEDFDDEARAPIALANEIGVPDYQAVADSAGQTEESYLEGTSVGSPTVFDEIVNHTADSEGWKFGYYGAAANTGDFAVAEDGETADIPIDLRYTVSFHTADEYTPLAMYDAYSDEIANVEENSAGTIPRSDLVVSGGHPSIVVEETSFQVLAENLPEPEAGATGDSNTAAE